MKTKLKSNKGITITSLVIYIVIFMIVLAIMSNITKSFYENISGITKPLTGITEFNKFSMLFIQDVKKNTTCEIVNNELTFEDGTVYRYNEQEDVIYRNDIKIAKYVETLIFTKLENTQEIDGETFTKEIVNINVKLKNDEESSRSIDFVLKYW